MKTIQFALILSTVANLCTFASANVIANFALDARNELNLQQLDLNAGQYMVSLQNRAFTAWSAWPETSPGCTNDCLQGWFNFFSVFNVQTGEGVYVENGIGTPFANYDFNSRLAYSTPEAALAAAPPYEFILNNPATVQISIPDCQGCFLDNRGGLSFSVSLVPEPGTFVLLLAIASARALQRRNRVSRREFPK